MSSQEMNASRIERETYNYRTDKAVAAEQVQRYSLRLHAPITFDPYFSGDGPALRVDGKILAVCIRSYARRRWWWWQRKIQDKFPIYCHNWLGTPF